MSTLDPLISGIEPIDPEMLEQAQQRLDRLTKPPGSLAQLERVAARIVAMTGDLRPAPREPVILTFAADHGVAAEGVSAYPQAVTGQMLLNFAAGGAAINVLARQAGARLVVVDVGTHDPPELPEGVVVRRVGNGTANMAREPAMTRDQAAESILIGAALASEEVDRGATLLAAGEMGIANTTAAAAITSVMTGESVLHVTGRGTGVDDARLLRKIDVIRAALARQEPHLDRPLDVLAAVGGFEIGAMTGVMLRAAASRIPVVLDGYICGAAALIAAGLAPAAVDYMIAGHRSAEPGHHAVLESLGLKPMVQLDLRLGEGTGAALAIPLIQSALAIYDGMASFDEAGVSDAVDE